MLLKDYVETLTEGQHLVIQDVQTAAQRSNLTKSFLTAIRKEVARCFLELWGENIFPAKVKLGYEPDWSILEIDWEVSMQMAFKKRSGGLIGFFVRLFGLETKLLNICYGLNLPPDLDKAGKDEAAIAIIVAALQDA